MSMQPKISGALTIGRAAGLALAIGLLAYWLAGSVLAPLELLAQDVLFLIRGPLETEHLTVLVAIDETSFAASDLQWPWPRDYIARIIDNIAAGHPKAIAIDVTFFEPTTEQQDLALADSVARAGNVVLLNNIITEEEMSGDVRRQLSVPISELGQAAAAQGFPSIPFDADGAVRRLLAFQAHNDQLYYSWSMQLARLYLGEESFNAVSRDEVRIGEHVVKLEDQFLRVDFRGPTGSIPTYSAYQVAEELVDPSNFEGKIVILGATSVLFHDSYHTPFGANPPMPGAEINAQAVEAILEGRFLTPTGSIVQISLAVLAALVGTALSLRLRPLVGLPTVIGLSIVYGLAAAIAFMQARVIMPITAPLLALGITFVASTSIQLYEEQRQRARVRGLFERYVSPAAIDQMLAAPNIYAVQGDRREMTIMFSDIRGFTSLSEKLSPDQVVEILNEYLTAMTEIIFKYNGTIDKFEGDAILAIWNAPLPVENHPTQAVLCAIEMAKTLSEMQKRWAATGHIVLKNGIGINTGMCFVGNIGSVRRMDYTVIGDTVNLAARLEALTKEIGVQILFSESTQQQLTPEVKTRYVTSATVKGRQQAVRVYTVDPDAHGIATDSEVDLEQMPEEIIQQRKD